MLKIEFTTADIEALRHWRFHHPHPKVQLKIREFDVSSAVRRCDALQNLRRTHVNYFCLDL